MIRGQVDNIRDLGHELVADVTLEGQETVVTLPIPAGLLEQWPADAIRAHLLQQAADTVARQQARTDALEAHQAIAGAGVAAPVCREGHLDCQDAHQPAGCGRTCTEDHAHHYDPALDPSPVGADGIAP